MLLRLFIIELEKLCSSCFLVEKYAKKRLECLGNVGWYINHGLSDKHLRAARFFVWIIFYFLPACSFNKSRISVSNTSSLLGAGGAAGAGTSSFLRFSLASIQPMYSEPSPLHAPEPGHLPFGKLMDSYFQLMKHFIERKFTQDI